MNQLEVRVTWNNRIAGDDLNSEKERFAIYQVIGYPRDGKRRLYNEKDMLESGLVSLVMIRFFDTKTNFKMYYNEHPLNFKVCSHHIWAY